MDIRQLHARHLEAYRALMLDAYDRHPAAFTATRAEREPLPRSFWANRLGLGKDGVGEERPRSLVLGAFEGGEGAAHPSEGSRILGVVGLEFDVRPKTRHKAKLIAMLVNRSARQRGVGHRLVEAALDRARRRGIQAVRLTVTEGNAAARRLYEAHGFRSFGVEPRAIRVDDEYLAKVHMVCDLRS